MKLILVSALLAVATSLAAEAAKPKILAAVVQVEDGIEVWMVSEAFWKKHKESLQDSYSEEESEAVSAIADKAQLCNSAESVYEPCEEARTVAQIKKDVVKAGAVNLKAMQKWAEEESKEQ